VTIGNAAADWDRWPVAHYLAENYRVLHPSDDAVLAHHSSFYRLFAPGALARTLELGAGPNLYPLMLAAAASRRIDALDRSAANLAYLTGQLRDGVAGSWLPFWARCRELNPDLPERLDDALARVRVLRGDALATPLHGYDAASMNFVAESVTEDPAEFARFCAVFARSVRPGGHLVAAFMENMPTYSLGDGSRWPGYPVDVPKVRAVFAPHVRELAVTRIDPDPTLPDYGYTGMVLLTARRPG
jgi:SAM-dependent methyltransferase